MKKKTLLKHLSLLLSLSVLGTSLYGCSRISTSHRNNTGGSDDSETEEASYASEPNEEFAEFMNDMFAEEIASNTINLHFTLTDPKAYGITDYEITFGDLSSEARQESYEEFLDTEEEFSAFDRDSLSKEQQLTYDIFRSYMDSEMALYEYELYMEPLAPSNGTHAELPILLAEYQFYCEQDVIDYIDLISTTDAYFADIAAFEQEKSDAGLFMNDDFCQQVIDACNTFVANPESNLLITTFDRRINEMSELSEDEKNTYKQMNRDAVLNHVVVAYQNLAADLTLLKGTGSNNAGLYYYADGCDYYELLVAYDTGCSDSVDTIYDRIENQRLTDLTAFSVLYSAIPTLLDEAENYEVSWTMETEEEMISRIQDEMLESFPEPVTYDYTIEYVDPSLSDSLAPAFYITAPMDNYLENKIFINSASDYDSLSYFTTLAHEGFPGHLYQTVMTYEYGYDPVRNLLGWAGYSEGWATYVEMESYYYTDLDESIEAAMQYNQAITLSLYASSDIGVHYYGWEYDDLAAFWEEYGITDEEALHAIYEYICGDPGNYLRYYVGYLEFLDIREQMEDTYEDEFDLVAFHEALLRVGPAPFDIVEEYCDYYYEEAVN